MTEKEVLIIHRPEVLEEEIRDCEKQLRALKSYLRASRNYYDDGERSLDGDDKDGDPNEVWIKADKDGEKDDEDEG